MKSRSMGTIATLAVVMAIAATSAVEPVEAQTSDATRFYTSGNFAGASGEAAYRVICQSCHMPDGNGAAGGGEYPSLAGNPKLAAGPFVVATVLDGRGGMPPFAELLDDRQIAEVATYVRTHFGNDFSEPLTAEDVKAMRRPSMAASP